MTALGIMMAGTAFLARHTERGVSEEAKAIQELVLEIERDIERSIALGKPYEDARTALALVTREASVPNWDGYDARQIEPATYENALRFLQNLPRSVPAPEISAEPDGEIALDWHVEGVGTLSVSIGPGSVVNYAGLFGKNKVYGTEYWGDEIPGPIIDNVVRLYSILARSA